MRVILLFSWDAADLVCLITFGPYFGCWGGVGVRCDSRFVFDFVVWL